MKRSILCLILVAACASFAFASGASLVPRMTLTVWDFKYSESTHRRAEAHEGRSTRLFQQKNPGVTIDHVAQPAEPPVLPDHPGAATANQGPDVAMFHPGARVVRLRRHPRRPRSVHQGHEGPVHGREHRDVSMDGRSARRSRSCP